jgi:hypothetical protein
MLGGSKIDGNSIYICAKIAAIWLVTAVYIEIQKIHESCKLDLMAQFKDNETQKQKQARLRARHTKRLSGVSSTVTPASTLPTVKETSMTVYRI